jgi:phosphatidylserine decarboxylase
MPSMKKIGADRMNPFAEGGETTIGVVAGIWAIMTLVWRRWTNPFTTLLFAPFTALFLIVLYFFRDPNRTLTQGNGLVVSPGDGEIVNIVTEREEAYLGQEVIRISIFLSLFDVHVQRTPIAGIAKRIQHQPGKFLQAFRPEASEVNEYIAMVIESPYGDVLVKQIAGILARRCVNYINEGDILTTGQRFGLIRFSSRVDLFLPPTANLLIKVGDKVNGGITPIAQLQN